MEPKMIWVTTGGACFDVVMCSGWSRIGTMLQRPPHRSGPTECLGLQMYGAPCALCVACAMYLEQLTHCARLDLVPGGDA